MLGVRSMSDGKLSDLTKGKDKADDQCGGKCHEGDGETAQWIRCTCSPSLRTRVLIPQIHIKARHSGMHLQSEPWGLKMGGHRQIPRGRCLEHRGLSNLTIIVSSVFGKDPVSKTKTKVGKIPEQLLASTSTFTRTHTLT